MKWLSYLLEANVYLALFYAAYYLALRRETYYQLNRIYLLVSSLMAFFIPLLQVGILKKPAPPLPVGPLADITLLADLPAMQHPAVPAVTPHDGWTIDHYIILLYVIVVAILTMWFIIRINQLIKLARRGAHTTSGSFNIIEIDDANHAFSFFSYLFISRQLSNSTTIIQHEMVHIRQKHSLDIVYLELLKIICWFNPVVYLMQNSLKELHEFIADRQVAGEPDIIDQYTDFLIGNAYGLPETTLVNNFFNKNLLKNRITMLHQKRSGSLARLKYLVALPLLAGMLCLSTLGFSKDYKLIDLDPAKIAANTHTTTPAEARGSINKIMTGIMNSRLYTHHIKKEYFPLTGYLFKTIVYPKNAVNKQIGGTVAVSFKVDDNSTISNITIAQSGGNDFDAAVVRSIQSYRQPVDFKAGNYTVGIKFIPLKNIQKVKVPAISTEIKNDAGYIGQVDILDTKLSVDNMQSVMQGLSQSLLKAGKFPGMYTTYKLNLASVNYHILKAIGDELYIKGYVLTYNENKITDELAISLETRPGVSWHDKTSAVFKTADLKKPGYNIVISADPTAQKVFVHGEIKAANNQNQIAVVTSTSSAEKPIIDTLPGNKAVFEPFYKELSKSIRYPTEARDKGQHGKVFVIFNVDENNKPYNFFIARGLTAAINAEVLRVLANCTMPATVKKDVNYTIPISFNIQNKATGEWLGDKTYSYIDANPAVNQNHKSLGYKTYLALNEVVIVTFVQQ